MKRCNINPIFIQAIFAVFAGAVSALLFSTGFGAIALSIFISLLMCGLLLLGNEYYNLKNRLKEETEELQLALKEETEELKVELASIRDDLNGVAELMQQKLIGLSEGFGQDLESIQEDHHEEIQNVYRVLSTIMGEGEE